MRYSIIIGLCVMLLIGPLGCAHVPLLPPPPSEEVRAKLGTIGVVSARFTPEAKVETPAKGRFSGAWKGAGQGGAKGWLLGGTIGFVLGSFVVAILFAPAGALAGGIVGSIHGAVTALPTVTVEQAEATLKAALSDLKIQEAMRNQIIKVAQDQTRYRFVLLTDQDPTILGAEVSYRPLAEKGIDTILKISVPTIRLEADLGANPPIALFMTVRARLVRTVDNGLLYDGTVDYRSGKHLFTEWATDHAQLLRKEFDRSYQSLADKIVEELFLLYLPERMR